MGGSLMGAGATGILTLAIAANGGQNIPTLWFVVAWAALAIGVVTFVASLVWPKRAAADAPSIDLRIDELEPATISNWDDDWRVTIRVTNNSDSEEVSAYLIAPVEGVAATGYGDINLQWDTVNTVFSLLVTGKPERLHIARVSRRRNVRFLSPGVFGGMPREFQQDALRVTDSPIRGWILFSTKFGCQERRRLEIHLDHSNKPTVQIGEPVPC